MAAPSVRSTGAATATNTTNEVAINKPAGLANGDVIYTVVIAAGTTAGDLTTIPSGWTELADVVNDNAVIHRAWLYRKVITDAANEPSTYTWACTVANSMTGCSVAVQGADPAAPEDVQSSRANAAGASGTTSITTTGADRLIIAATVVSDNMALSSWACATDPTTLTENIEQMSSGGNDSAAGFASAPKTSQGATGAMSVTIQVGNDSNVGFLVAVKPPPAVNAPAGNAPGTGTALNTSATIQHPAEVAPSTGAALDAIGKAGPNAESASGAGAAFDTARVQVGAVAESANATGTALDASAKVDANDVGAAPGVGAAFDAAVRVGAVAEVAPSTGEAFAPSITKTGSTEAAAQVASGSGAAHDTSAEVVAPSSTSTGVGTALDSGAHVYALAGLAAGTGTAYEASVPVGVGTTPPIEFALANPSSVPQVDTNHTVRFVARVTSGTGTAHYELRQGATTIESWAVPLTTSFVDDTHSLDPLNVATITDYNDLRLYAYIEGDAGALAEIALCRTCFPVGVTITYAAAGVATGFGTAHTGAASIGGQAGRATGSDVIGDPRAHIGAPTGRADGTGTAYDPLGLARRFANAGLATGTGSANGTSTAIAAVVGLAPGLGLAFNPTVKVPTGGVACLTVALDGSVLLVSVDSASVVGAAERANMSVEVQRCP